MNKTILFVGNSLLTMLNFRWHTIKYLADLGYKIHILAPYDAKYIDYQNVEFFAYGDSGRATTLYGLLSNVIQLRKKLNVVRESDQIYLFAYSPKIILISTLATLGTRCIFVPFFIGLGTLFIKKKYFLIKNLLGLLINLNKCCSVVVCLNTSDKVILSRLLKNKKIRVLKGEGLPDNQYRFIDYNKADTLRFILIARPLKDKGATLFLNAAKHFKNQLGMNAQFSIYGFDEATIGSDLATSFTNDCFKYDVNLHGFVCNIENHVKSRDVLVLPSIREGMSRVCMEMTEFGLPVIASDVPGIADIVTNGHTGVLISTMNPISFASAMVHFAKLSPTDFNQLRLNIKNSPRRYASRKDVNVFFLSILSMH
jgi:glycosyltransferase involved in cell wall biosynthesis